MFMVLILKLKKEECVNHVSKRLGTSLRKVVQEWRTKGVTLGGKSHGSLKEETIKKLSRYYQNAILRNKGNVNSMKTAIYATLLHIYIAFLQIKNLNIINGPLEKYLVFSSSSNGKW
ncbi:hypothetical protein AVEN_77836-1 [Araneus ventricosus]|uniref:Mutator-like transposase domain-containing protein n=1 Tax=Araneus ventricosus TaxID=182803 RepID=A0A4Y2GM49_ARAVE|nr:hypothetical protein AVEN_77836-1 [Araneus ventricosus]